MENPLLPHARLRELHARMTLCRALDRKAGTTQGFREGLLAATSIHLEAGDLLCPEPGDTTAATLAPNPVATATGLGTPGDLPASLRLPLCAGVARGLQVAGKGGLVLAYMRLGSVEPGWADALAWAQRDRLPLLLTCFDIAKAGRPRTAEPMSRSALTAIAERLHLPAFTVEAEDALAVYRVMHECTLRARAGGGPAVIWGVFAARGPGKPSSAPLPRLKAYLKAQNVRLRA